MKMKFEAFGDWSKVQKLVHEFPREAEKINKQSLMQAGLKAEAIAVKHLQSQDLGWKPLQEKTMERKLKKGLSEKTLIETSSYFQAINSNVKGNTVFAGVLKTKKYKDGQSIANIARVHEFGSVKMNIPERPLWRPTMKEWMEWMQRTKYFSKRLHDKMMQLYK